VCPLLWLASFGTHWIDDAPPEFAVQDLSQAVPGTRVAVVGEAVYMGPAGAPIIVGGIFPLMDYDWLNTSYHPTPPVCVAVVIKPGGGDPPLDQKIKVTGILTAGPWNGGFAHGFNFLLAADQI
jgi:hypothetical protein